MHACVHVPYNQPNGWIDQDQTCTWIHLNPEIELGKSRSRSEHRVHENGGAAGAESDRDGANAIGMSIEAPKAPRRTEDGRMP